MEKKCFKCNKVKNLSEFYKHSQMADGHVNKCKECNKNDVRKDWYLKREEKREYDIYRHRYSIQRFFSHKYNLIKSRCSKYRQTTSRYFGKDFLTKSDWNEWCYEDRNYKAFIKLYNKWVENGFERKSTPSIDRIDNKLGYMRNNLQWLSLSDNSSKGIKSGTNNY